MFLLQLVEAVCVAGSADFTALWVADFASTI